MGIDLNQDMGELIKSLMEKRKAPKAETSDKAEKMPRREKAVSKSLQPYKRVIVLSTTMVVAVACYVWLYALPSYQTMQTLKGKIETLETKERELIDLGQRKRTLSKQIETNAAEFKKLLAAFDNTQNVDQLYQSISQLAMVHKLGIQNLQKGTTSSHADYSSVDATEVTINLSGKFHHYVEFKKDLAESRPLLTVKSEQVSTDTTRPGSLSVSLKLATYTIDKAPFKAVLAAR